MSRFHFAAFAAALLFACGGKGKSKTTPNPTETDASSDPTKPAPGLVDPLDGQAAQPGSTTNSRPSGPVEIEAPNLDTDPVRARAQVTQHLDAARAALAKAPADADAALRSAKLALEVDAASVDAAAMVALAYYHKRLYDTAEVLLDDLFLRPAAKQNANVSYVYGLVYEKQGESQRSQLAFQTAVGLDPTHISAWINVGAGQLRNKQYAEAAQTYERVTQSGRNTASVWNSLGASYRGLAAGFPPGASDRTTYLRQAESAYKRAMTEDRTYASSYYNLGLLYLDANPFPGDSGGDLDTLQRLNRAKTYFDQYRDLPGANSSLYDERTKDVNKLIKREEKKRAKAGSSS